MANVANDILDTVSNVIKLCRDGEQSFAAAAQAFDRHELKNELLCHSRERADLPPPFQMQWPKGDTPFRRSTPILRALAVDGSTWPMGSQRTIRTPCLLPANAGKTRRPRHTPRL